MKQVPLTNGGFTLVDDEDYERVSQYRWFAMKDSSSPPFWYVCSTSHPHIRMHRLIMGCTSGDGIEIDHVNHDTFDNRKENLEVASKSDNQHNRLKARRDSKTGVRGVSYLPNFSNRSPYRAFADFNKKKVYFGHYATLEEAAEAVKEGRKRLGTYKHQT